MTTDALPPLTEAEKVCLVSPIVNSNEITSKLNELIAAHNRFVIMYAQHRHGHIDSYTQGAYAFTTSTPKED